MPNDKVRGAALATPALTSVRCYQCAVDQTGDALDFIDLLGTPASSVLIVNDDDTDAVYVSHSSDDSAVAPTVPAAVDGDMEEIALKVNKGESLSLGGASVGKLCFICGTGLTAAVRVFAWWS